MSATGRVIFTIVDLVGGPQDGAKIVTLTVPAVVFVGPKWLGDGFSAFRREESRRFPCCYRYAAGAYRFVSQKKYFQP